jgi:hypothetical protein
MRWMLAAVLVGHGIAHLVGFAVNWQLVSDAERPFTTSILGGWDVGPAGIKVLGVMWLAPAAAFLAAAALLIGNDSSALAVMATALAASFAMCLLQWPTTYIGFNLDVLLVAFVFLGPQIGWRLFPHAP